MLKRVPLTALALGMAWAGFVHAQLVIDDSAPRPVVHAVVPAVQPALMSSAARPVSGLVIVDGYDDQASPVQVATRAPLPIVGHVTEIGLRPTTVSKVEGWADAVPLSVALAQVIPHGFNVDSAGLDTGSRTVSWSGNHRAWPDVLSSLATVQKLAIVINWKRHEVSIKDAHRVENSPVLVALPPAPNKSLSVPTVTTTSTTTTVVKSQPAVVEAMPVTHMVVPVRPVTSQITIQPAQATVQTWRLDPAKTLKENVQAWAKQAGWNRVVWEGADYPIAAPAVFSGRFDAQDGPLAQLIAGFANSDQPLLVRLTIQDRVIHVVNKNYTPAQVDSVSATKLAPSVFDLSGNGGHHAADPAPAADTAQNIQAGSKMAPIRIDDRGSHAAHH